MTDEPTPLPRGVIRAKQTTDLPVPVPPLASVPQPTSHGLPSSARRASSLVATPDKPAPQPGRITAIEEQARHKDRVNIYIDGVFAIGLFADVAVALSLKIGQEVTADGLATLADAEHRRRAKEDAYRLLSFRARTEKEIVDRLKRREYDDAVIAETVAYLHAEHLLDDADFAARFAATRSRTHGDRAITMELRQKGVDANTIKETLAESADEDAEHDTVFALAEKRVGNPPRDTSPQAKQKLWAFLARRGFGSDVIKRVTNRLYSGSRDDD